MEYKFDNDFRFKNLPDESTPINADNLNKALDNTSWLKSQLDGTIEPMSGSSIEINDCAEAMLNKLEIEGKSTQDGEPSPENPVEIKSVGKLNDQGKYEIELTISNDTESKTTTFVLNEPLRSLPNEIKDLLYIKSGHLYVERNVGYHLFTKNDDLSVNSIDKFRYPLAIRGITDSADYNNPKQSNLLSNIFMWHFSSETQEEYKDMATFRKGYDAGVFFFFIPKSYFTSTTREEILAEFKQKISENKLDFLYVLAEPTIEDLGEIEMPSTYKDKSTITTTDELEPTINLEYVKDTILTNYVEKRLINLMK